MKHIKTLLMLVVIFIGGAAKIQQQARCPQICNCTQISDKCSMCLEEQFNREFNQINKTCPCLSDYTQNYPPSDFCCAKNCSVCYRQGCLQCRRNWTKILIRSYYICACKTNYAYDNQLDDCICLANIQNSYSNQNQLNYFSPSRFQCYRCPIGCKCNASGCYKCEINTNRGLKLTANNVWTCFCQNGYKEDQNGFCIQLNYILNCSGNRILINNQCVCTQPFYQVGEYCVCKSNLYPTSYYMYLGICYVCPPLCRCSELGCVHCSINSRRKIIENNCSCDIRTGARQIDGQCICISPLNSGCNCNSYYYPQKFFLNTTTNKCIKCPKGCICNKTVISCDSSSKRYSSSAKCISPWIQIDGQCIGCSNNFIYINKSCICPTELLFQINNYYLLFYDQQRQTCNNCPVGCICNTTGCILCDSSLNRNITLNKYGISTCYCNSYKKFQQNSLGICQCIFPYTYDQTIGSCRCQEPYFFNNSECICKVFENSTKYYLSPSGCKLCPIQCACSDYGCYICSSKTGRSIINYYTNYFICPCFPIQFNQWIGYCNTCPFYQYLWKNKCINCDSNCLTCNEYGCLSCKSDMKLFNNKCFCSNNLFFNGNQCMCAKGYFLDDVVRGNCLPCPANCQNCYQNTFQAGMVECIECNISLFRKNDIINNCPCRDYYMQGPITYPYCCHWSCRDCNISGCLSCLPFTFRELNYSNLNNITCSCKLGFIESYTQFCQCPRSTYLYINQCLQCPEYCLECKMTIIQLISCTVCAEGFNRKNWPGLVSMMGYIVQIIECVCDQRYVPYTNSSYCYPRGCIQILAKGICKKCDVNRTISQSGKNCTCNVGFYTDSFYDCKPCSFNCIQCISFDICTACNTSNNSYLVLNKKDMQIQCIIPDRNKSILVHNSGNFILQFMNPFSVTKEMQIYLILLTSEASIDTIQLNVKRFKNISKEYFMMEFTNLLKDRLDKFLLYINTTAKDYQGYFQINDEIYLAQTLNYPYMQSILIRIFIVFVMIASLTLHILGQKSNQLIQYCQTIFFVVMNIKDSHMYIVPLLNYFRITTFNFTFPSSGSPFNDLLDDWDLFIERCDGNYKYFSMDNNLIRNAGLALYLTIQTAFFSTIFRISYYFLYRSKYKPLIKKYKKIVYRSIEWVYQVTMYPLIFYSLSTVINYKSQYSLVNEQFRQLNFRLSIFILICYTVVTIIQSIFQDISKIHRYSITIKYIFNIINSIIIIYSVYNRLIFALIFSMFLRSTLQYIISRLYMRKFSSLYNYINLLNMLQCSVIIGIYFNNKISTITLILSYIFGTIIMRILLIRKKYMHYKFEKNIVITLENQAITNDSKFITEMNQISQPKKLKQSNEIISTVNVINI